MSIYLAKNIQTWPITRLKVYEKNSRTHPREQIKKLKRSIQEFGFLVPILVYEKDSKIIAGEGRLIAAQELGLDEVTVIVLDHLTPAQRKAYVIADNKIAQESGWDIDNLESEIDELVSEGYDPTHTGYSEQELERFIEETEIEADEETEIEEPDPMDESDEELLTEDEMPTPEPEPEAFQKEESKNVKLKPISKSADLWLLDGHQLVVGESNESEADAIIIGWQKLTKKKAKLKGSKFNFDELRQQRDSKVSTTLKKLKKK